MLYYKPITKDTDNPTGQSKPKLKAYMNPVWVTIYWIKEYQVFKLIMLHSNVKPITF